MGRGLAFAVHTLEEALKRPGATSIVLTPGVYQAGTVRLTRSVVLSAEPGALLAAHILVLSGQATLVDLDLTGGLLVAPGTAAVCLRTALTAEGGPALAVGSGARVQLDHCRIRGAPGQGAAVQLTATGALSARTSRISAPRGTLILLTGRARADIASCQLILDAGSGAAIDAREEASATVADSSLDSGPEAAPGGLSALVSASSTAQLTIRHTSLTSVGPGVLARGESRTTLADCVGRRLAPDGPAPIAAWLDAADRAVVALAGGRVEAGRGPAAVVGGHARLTLERLAVLGSGGVGVHTAGSGQLTLRALDLAGFHRPLVGGGGHLHVTDSRIVGGGPAATLLEGSGTEATFERCAIEDSDGPAIQLEAQTACTLADTAVRGSRGTGVAIGRGAQATLLGCVLEENDGPAVAASPGARGLIARCVMRGSVAPLAIDGRAQVSLEANVLPAT